MRISELARRSGVSVGTVKYYLREGLLPPGEATSATQAQYTDEHVTRLGLIRALLGPGRLSVAAARDVLAAVDDPELSAHQVIGAVHGALPPGSMTTLPTSPRYRNICSVGAGGSVRIRRPWPHWRRHCGH